MKMLILVSALLTAQVSFAATDSAKVCNSYDATQSFEITVVGDKATMRSSSGSDSSSQVATIKRQLPTTKEQLTVLKKQAHISAKLTEGTTYQDAQTNDVFVIALDKNAVQYVITVIPGGAVLMGSSANCK